MKNYICCLLVVLSVCVLPLQAAETTEELVIEMTGPQTDSKKEQTIWDKDARQLTRLFRGKSKDYVLETVNAISGPEKQITATDGKTYQWVQYGQDTRDYRKFLFENAAPYTFVSCAASAADVIAVFQRYGVNMGLRQADFLSAYSSLEKPTQLPSATTVLTVYTIPADRLPLKAEQPLFAVFDQNRLVELLSGEEALENYKKALPQPPTLPEKSAPQPVTQKKAKKPYKALLSGGTTEDQMYMPRVVRGPFTPKAKTQNTPAN